MEQELKFGLDLGQLALLKKYDYEQLLRPDFSCFHGHFFLNKNIVASTLKSRLK